jgi:hypothetical protein
VNFPRPLSIHPGSTDMPPRGRYNARTHQNAASVQAQVFTDANSVDLTPTFTELNLLDGITGYPVQCAEVTFTETAGAGVWTGSVSLPAGAILLDIIVHAVALWNSETSATMKVGDVANDDGYYVDVDLKATDLLAGEGLSFSAAGGQEGADFIGTLTHVGRRYLATARVISGIITKVGDTGTAGRTRMIVVWAATQAQTAATKV